MTRYIVTFIKDAMTKEVDRKGFEYEDDANGYAIVLITNMVTVLRITDLTPKEQPRRRGK